MITDVDDYFTKGCGRCARFDTVDCSTKLWAVGQSTLRQICLDAGLVETVKWGHPCYMWQNRNIVIMGAFRNYFHLTFMNAALLRDSKNVLEKSGPNTRHTEMLRFLNNEQATTMRPIITAYLHESVGYARAGIKPQVEARVVTLQPELVDALGQDQEFSLKFFM